MSGLCLIVAAGELRPGELRPPEGAFVIAADAGFARLKEAGIAPDLAVGDFDSLGAPPEGFDGIVRHPPEKDDTDTVLAVREALKRGFGTIVILGGLGGRFDHSIANLQTLHFIAENGAAGYLMGDGWICSAIKNGGIRLPEGGKGTVSVFSLTTSSEGVCLKGLKYPLEDYTLSAAFPLGVSNERAGGTARISVRQGVLAVMWQGDISQLKGIERF